MFYDAAIWTSDQRAAIYYIIGYNAAAVIKI